MRTKLVLGMALALTVAWFSLAPVASAGHGPFCEDAPCCFQYEQGQPLARCLICPGPLMAWDTHENQCHLR